ncbi:MAG: HAD-IIIA family hydrolase [Legionella sp.]|nr:HAD-IIIA family hydrolase [Legionella sp.]
MSKRYRLVVFDWEGTLSDTLGQVLNCVAVEARRLNFGELNEEVARQSVELGLVNAIKKVFPTLTLYQHEQLLSAVQHSLMSKHSDVYLIPGAMALVRRIHLAGIDLAIATNKGQQALQRALSRTGLDEFFKVTRSAGQTAPKPATEMLDEIVQAFAIPVEDALMIGDSTTDMEMANNFGMDAIGVNFYHQSSESLLDAGALAVFDDYQRVADFLQL